MCSVQLYRLYLVKGTEVVDEVTFFAIEHAEFEKEKKASKNNRMVKVTSGHE